MIVDTYNLPSKGFNTSIKTVELKTMTYGDILHYKSRSCTPNTIEWLEYEISSFLMSCKSVSAFDILPLLTLAKFDILSKVKEFNCDNETFTITDIKFTEMSDDIKKIAKIGDLSFRVPLIGDVLHTLSIASDKSINFIEGILACYLGIEVSDLMKLNFKYSGTLENLKSKIISYPYILGKGGEEIRFSIDKISDLFLGSLYSEESNNIKIEYNEEVKS